MKRIRIFGTRSLKYQLLSRTLMILAVLLILIGLFQYALMKNFLYGNKASSIETQIDALPLSVWNNVSRYGTVPNRNALFELETPGSTIAFVGTNGKFVDLFEDRHSLDGDDVSQGYQSGAVVAPQLSKPAYQEALTRRTDMTFQVNNFNGNELLVVLHRIGNESHPIGVVQVTTPVDPLQDILIKQLTIFAFLIFGALIAGLMVFIPILRRTLVPLTSMGRKVSKINAGNLDERLPTEHNPLELEVLATSFNSMLERLETSFETERDAKERMRQFIADASHELRTPLTTMHGFIEVLLRGAAKDPIKLQKSLHSMYEESERMNKLVQDLLYLARLDRAPTFAFRNTLLNVLILGMESQLRLLAGERVVNFKIAENIRVNCDSDKIKQVVLNLFHNAVQHTDSMTGEIEVAVTKDRSGAMISVRDNGEGIPDRNKAHLFERFYRVDLARSRRHGGVGLGLSITKSIVDHHGGAITFESNLGKGTVFHVWLPTNIR